MPRLLFVLVVLVGPSLPARSAGPPTNPSELPAGARLHIGTPRFRHGGVVRAVAFSPNGKWLASASHDHTVSVWEVPGGRERHRFRGHAADVLCVAFSADGRLVASGGADGVLRLWSVRGATAGQELLALSSKAEAVEALAFAPGGKVLAAGGDDGVVRLYDLAGRELRQMSQDRGIRCLAWSSDGKVIATNGAKQAVTLWDADTGSRLRTFGDEAINCLTFAPAGRQLVSWEAGGVLRLWDADKGVLVRSWGGGGPEGGTALIYQIAFSRDGKSVFCGDLGGAVAVWDPETGKRRKQLVGHQGRVPALAVSPQGSLLATGGADGTIRLWDAVASKQVTPTVEPSAAIRALSLDPKGKQLALVLDSGRVQLWDHSTGKPSARFSGDAVAAAFGPDGVVTLVDARGKLVRWNPKTGETTSPKQEGPAATGLAVSADGKTIVTTHTDGALWLRDGKGAVRRACSGKDRRVTAAVSPDGGLTAAVGQSAGIAMWTSKTGKPESPLAGHRGGTLTAVFSSDGKRLASGGRDGMARLWDLESGKEIRSHFGHGAWVCAIALSPDGKLLAAATVEGDIQVWQTQSGRRLLADLEGHRGPVAGLAFADDRTLVSAGRDTSVLVWDVAALHAGRVSLMPTTAARREKYWALLALNDGAGASLAMQRLARDPLQTVPYLRARLAPVDGKKIAKWLEELDSDEFKVREAAFKGLAALGRFAEASLRQALVKKPNLEKHRRLEELLARLTDEKVVGEHLRALRAVEVLEMIGSAEARKVLEALAGGAGEAELTLRAKSALQRMNKP